MGLYLDYFMACLIGALGTYRYLLLKINSKARLPLCFKYLIMKTRRNVGE
jgi:hypothetical protein